MIVRDPMHRNFLATGVARLAVVNILASPHTVLFAPDRKHLICAGNGLWLCDFAGNPRHTFRKPSGYGVSSVLLARTLLFAKSSSVIRCWNVKTRALEAELEPKALGYHVLASVSADGKRVLTTTRNKAFTVWDLAREDAIATCTEKRSFVASAALSADGRTVAYGGTDGAVRFFDVASNRMTSRSESSGSIAIVTRSDDGRFFASAGRAGIISLWNQDGTLHRKLTQGGNIVGLAFSPDAGLIVAHAGHGLPVIWDVASGKRVTSLEDHEPKGLLGGTRSVRFSADGKRIVTMGNDCRAVVSKIV